MRFQRACFVGDLLKSALHLYKPKCQQVKAGQVTICPGQTEACLRSFILPVLIENNYVWNFEPTSSSDNGLPLLTWVGGDELGDGEAGRGPGHVHHGPGGLIKQCLVRVDPGNAHGAVPDIETGKWIVWELGGNWTDCNTSTRQPSQPALLYLYLTPVLNSWQFHSNSRENCSDTLIALEMRILFNPLIQRNWIALRPRLV